MQKTLIGRGGGRTVWAELSDSERMEMMSSHKYGSVCGGVYRKNLIVNNDLYFPEHLTYEDNYWVYTLQMFLQSVTVVPQKLYYYRQQDKSTCHKKNAEHHYDRIEIGRRFLRFVKDKQLLQRYHDIIEYLFIDVFTLNSYSMFLKYFDQPQAGQLEYVKRELKREFPRWRKNKFYKTKFSTKRKIKMNLVMVLPVKWYIRFRKYI